MFRLAILRNNVTLKQGSETRALSVETENGIACAHRIDYFQHVFPPLPRTVVNSIDKMHVEN